MRLILKIFFNLNYYMFTNILNIFLSINGKINVIKNNIYNYFSDTEDVYVFNEKTKNIEKCYYKYMFFIIFYNSYKYLNKTNSYYLINGLLHPFRNILLSASTIFNIKFNKICVKKRTKYGPKFLIKQFDQVSTFKTMVEYTNKNNYIVPCVLNKAYIKFIVTGNKIVPFQQFLIPYGDPNKLYDNTLENILLFNNYSINKNKVVIKLLENSKPIKKEYNYDKVKGFHISFF